MDALPDRRRQSRPQLHDGNIDRRDAAYRHPLRHRAQGSGHCPRARGGHALRLHPAHRPWDA
uniref:Uncharacterized protein n=1 Tax=uncultured marine virus TaxID=186617 RepID=A0A0F7L5M4_9VIRU|nr:hypothetical protein [uncultured marine virus]